MKNLRAMLLMLCFVAAAAGAGCSTAHYTINTRLTETRADTGYAIRNLAAPDNSDSMIVMVAFSGGGYRAAAMALAVMELLRDTPIAWNGQQKRLLDEVDFISSVSGGSLAAAWFALHRETFFDTFESQVLALDLQALLTARILSPEGLFRQTSARYGRSDLLQEVLDQRLFHGAKFQALPRQRPMVFINATDIRYGERFEFSQDQFDPLCSDLESFPLSRAVAASMAVPLLFSPVTLWNHSEHCEVFAPKLALESQAERSRFVHLADGGLADNTGVNAALEIIGARGGLVGSAVAAGFSGVRKRVFIIVNAQVNPTHFDDDSADTPGLLRQVRSIIDVPINRHARTSMRALENATRQWTSELESVPDHALLGAMRRDTDFHVVEISLMKASEGPDKDHLEQIPTALRVSPNDVAALRQFVRKTVSTDPQWQRLIRDLQLPTPVTRGADDN